MGGDSRAYAQRVGTRGTKNENIVELCPADEEDGVQLLAGDHLSPCFRRTFFCRSNRDRMTDKTPPSPNLLWLEWPLSGKKNVFARHFTITTTNFTSSWGARNRAPLRNVVGGEALKPQEIEDWRSFVGHSFQVRFEEKDVSETMEHCGVASR